eukprot:11153604-Karenia_brevis.AAC.1
MMMGLLPYPSALVVMAQAGQVDSQDVLHVTAGQCQPQNWLSMMGNFKTGYMPFISFHFTSRVALEVEGLGRST